MAEPTGDQQSPPSPALDAGERAELDALRAEVDVLRERTARRGRHRWRTAGAVALIGCGVALAPVAVTAVWLNSQISDTDRYVATVAPLANDPAIQQAVTDRITSVVFDRIDVAGITGSAADALQRQGAPPAVATGLHALSAPIANGVRSWTHDQVGRLVASEQFAQAWSEANRVAHTQLLAVLTGDDSGVLVTRGDTVSVRLATFIEAVKQRLVAEGFTLASKVPAVDAEFVVFRSADVGKAQAYFRWLSALGVVLPLLCLALLVLGVLAAPGRRRALLGAATGVALAMVLLGVALALIRPRYLAAIPDDVLPPDAAMAVFDTIVVYLRTALRAVLALAVVVAAIAYLSGPAAAAVAARRTFSRGAAALRDGAGRHGLRTGPVGRWIGAHRRSLRAVIAASALAVLVFWDYPTAVVVALTALVALLAVAVVEVVGTAQDPRSERVQHR